MVETFRLQQTQFRRVRAVEAKPYQLISLMNCVGFIMPDLRTDWAPKWETRNISRAYMQAMQMRDVFWVWSDVNCFRLVAPQYMNLGFFVNTDKPVLHEGAIQDVAKHLVWLEEQAAATTKFNPAAKLAYRDKVNIDKA